MAPKTFILLALGIASLAACAPEAAAPDLADDEFADNSAFDPNLILTDEFYLDVSMTVEEMERYLETGPYYGCQRIWLADEVVNGVSAAELIVTVSEERGINPLMVLARMQVEQSLISKATRPANTDYALGCHDPVFDPDYPNGLTPRMRPLDVQLECATDTLINRFRDSVNGKGQWRKGVPNTTEDGIEVTPANDATAALYAYTPHVAEGSGGAWLVWSVTNKFDRHLQALRSGAACR